MSFNFSPLFLASVISKQISSSAHIPSHVKLIRLFCAVKDGYHFPPKVKWNYCPYLMTKKLEFTLVFPNTFGKSSFLLKARKVLWAEKGLLLKFDLPKILSMLEHTKIEFWFSDKNWVRIVSFDIWDKIWSRPFGKSNEVHKVIFRRKGTEEEIWEA